MTMPLLFGIDDAIIIGGLVVVGVVVIVVTYAYRKGAESANPANPKKSD